MEDDTMNILIMRSKSWLISAWNPKLSEAIAEASMRSKASDQWTMRTNLLGTNVGKEKSEKMRERKTRLSLIADHLLLKSKKISSRTILLLPKMELV
jgi:hypothetical protein